MSDPILQPDPVDRAAIEERAARVGTGARRADLRHQTSGLVLPTLEADGSRRWLAPRLSMGRFWRRRRVVAYGLIAFLTVLPLITINGKPAVLLDIVNRQFTLFGYTFLPTDTSLLALLLIAWFASIFLTSAVAGRAWCGWTCPQTVYLEFVFRPIERLCLGRRGVGGIPRPGVAGWRYVAMYALFALTALVVTHTLLSYFVGAAQLRQWITRSPTEHPAAFLVIAVSSIAVFYNFGFFREQMCSIACPYGRFQSVLFDRDSIGVHYDASRGEPRGKGKNRTVALPLAPDSSPLAPPASGDCIDCTMCVQVCPAGIDIRNGPQLECVHCTQCIDACDAVMDRIDRPRGLIGYHSTASLEGDRTRLLRPRVILYSAITVGFLVTVLVLVLTKQTFDAAIVRNAGLPFFVTPVGQVQNTMRLTLRNRTDRPQTFRLTSHTPGVTLAESSATVDVAPQASTVVPLHLFAEPGTFPAGRRTAIVEIADQDGQTRTLTCQLLGPGVSP